MRSLCLVLVAGALACGGKSSAPTTPAPAPAPPDAEVFGQLHDGLDAAAVEALLGPPDSRTEPEEMGATGEWVSSWTWAAQGVALSMAAGTADGAPTVDAISISAPSKLTTSRGVGIGTPRAEVERIYGPYRATDAPAESTDPDMFLVGSIYGGTFFTFTDGKVSEIFVGTGAE